MPGLVKLVDRQEIEAADWSLTPGRYVGVAPPEEDDDFDFEATLRDLHTELAGLNEEAVELAKKIQANFEQREICFAPSRSSALRANARPGRSASCPAIEADVTQSVAPLRSRAERGNDGEI